MPTVQHSASVLYLFKWLNYILPPPLLQGRRFPSSLSPYTAHLRLQATAVPFLACPLPGDRAPTSRATGHVATAEPHGCVDGAQGTGIRGKSCLAASWLSGLHERRFYTSPASFSPAPITFLEVCSLKSCCRGQMLVLFAFKK